MTIKNSFVFYSEWAEQIAIIADAEGGMGVMSLFNALSEYLEDGEVISSLSPIVKLVFNQIRNQLDRDKAKYKKKVEQRIDAANKRWGKDDAEECETMRNDAKRCEPMRSEGDIGVRNKVDDTGVKDIGVEDDADVSPAGDIYISSPAIESALPAPTYIAETDPKKLTERMLEEEFDALWLLYPRKDGRKDALRHYKAARREGVTFDEVESGIKRYANYVRDKDPTYTAMGSTWFCGHRWEDRIENHGPRPGSMAWLANIANGGALDDS